MFFRFAKDAEPLPRRGPGGGGPRSAPPGALQRMYEPLFPHLPEGIRRLIAEYATCEDTPVFSTGDGRSITVLI